MEPQEKATQKTRGKMIMDNFLGGISWALGVWIGATLFIAIIVFVLSKVNYIPIVGDFMVDILNYVGQNSLKLSN